VKIDTSNPPGNEINAARYIQGVLNKEGIASEIFEAAPGRASLVGRTVADVERDLILETLQHCLGNRTHAANILGISIRTLRNKLQQYRQEGLAVPYHGESERATA